MKRIICRLVTAMVLLVPVPLAAQTNQSSDFKFIVLMHAGPKLPDDESIRQITGILVRSGYVVRAPDNERDLVGGPGVDYFSDAALPAAKQLADLLNAWLSKLQQGAALKPLNPRKQNVNNPANYFDVWLF